MTNYVSVGYVKTGYVKGVNPLLQEVGQHPIKFFVSSGRKTEDELKSAISSIANSTDISIIYMPEKKKILLGSKAGFIEFLGGVDIQSILTDSAFIDKVGELATVNLSASITANSGSTIANPKITQIDATTFEVTVPPELVGKSYKIKFNQS